jgi:hypothetical protein
MKRDIQLSLDGTMDRAIGALPVSVVTGNNAELIRTVAPLYLDGVVLDVTYGLGNWWTSYRPLELTTHDVALDGVDFRKLPEADASFDAVCFDPPYITTGGAPTSPRLAEFRTRYGLAPREYRGFAATNELIGAGLAECARVTRRWLLVKCMDYTDGGQLHFGHLLMIRWADDLGLELHDLVVHASGRGTGGWNIVEPQRCTRAHSYLLIFRKRTRPVRPKA